MADVPQNLDFFKMKNGMYYAGTHLIIDLYDCEFGLNDAQFIERVLRDATDATGATLLMIKLHSFNPTGVSGVAVLAESHISIHTWPETGFAAMDVFTCGACDPQRAVPVLKKAFRPGSVVLDEIDRGHQGLRIARGIAPVPSRFSEVHGRGWKSSFDATEVIYHEKENSHSTSVFVNPEFGRVLMLDGVTQVTEKDEFIHHEMLAHVPLFTHGNVKSVCVIGGGEGGIVREVLRHQTVEKVTLVESDRRLIDLSIKYFPHISKEAFKDPRLNIVIADGSVYMNETSEMFDLIIVDSSDLVASSRALFTEEFYGDCHSHLVQDGILVVQAGVISAKKEKDQLTRVSNNLKKHFNDTAIYTTTVPTYVGGLMALGWASDNPNLRDISFETLQERFDDAAFATQQYTPEIHLASFVVPPYISALI